MDKNFISVYKEKCILDCTPSGITVSGGNNSKVLLSGALCPLDENQNVPNLQQLYVPLVKLTKTQHLQKIPAHLAVLKSVPEQVI